MAPTVQVLPPSSNWMAYSFLGVGGHDGGGSIGAALLVRSQLCGGGRDAPGKGVDDHGLTDDTGGSGQNVLRVDAQLLAHQLTAFFGQSHAVGGAGVGVAAVHDDRLCVAVLQVGAVHLDGCAADLVGGVHTGGGAAHVRFDECQIVFFLHGLRGCRSARQPLQSPLGAQMPPATS